MTLLTDHDVEEFKRHRWFIMHHREKCTICGKDFSNRQKKCYHIPMPDAKLWRYMDLAKFLSLLESSSLFFTRLDHFEDPFEGALGIQTNEDAWAIKEKTWRMLWLENERKSKKSNLSRGELEVVASEKFKEYRENAKKWRKINYVCCWHQSDSESEAMWKLYTRDTKQGIAIQTTFRRLYQSLPTVPQADFGMVNYIDYKDYNNGRSSNTFHPFEAPWYKRKSFEHEKEFRIIIEDNSREWNKKIKVDINLLIENVYISPQADPWFTELVHSIIRNRYKLCLNICQSNLNETPFY